MKITLFLLTLLPLSFCPFVNAQKVDKSILTLERIYTNLEFDQPKLGTIQWFKNGKSYTMLEKDKDGVQNIIEYDSKSGSKNIILSSNNLIPYNSNRPLEIYNYEFSSNMDFVLIFTNTKRVWRTNTRGDYWILNMNDNSLKKLGGYAKSSTLMFATISPNHKYVAYVKENNL